MNAEQISKEIGRRKPWHNKHKWIDHEILAGYQNFLVYGDDGGDLFVHTFDTPEGVRQLAEDHANGRTDCDFETHDYLIVTDGKKMKTSVVLVEDTE